MASQTTFEERLKRLALFAVVGLLLVVITSSCSRGAADLTYEQVEQKLEPLMCRLDVEQTDIIGVLGKPTKTQKLHRYVYLYYKVEGGTVQIVLKDGYIDSVNLF